MEDPMVWLSKTTGFSELAPDELDAIMQFALLWSFFESKVLNNGGSAMAISKAVEQWKDDGKLAVVGFQEPLEYFRQRYFSNGNFTHYFYGLLLRKSDRPALVRAVLSGQNAGPVDSVAAVLIIVWRLRNNLFHGMKWAYGIHGQLGNFQHANAALMSALDTHGN